MKSKYRKEKLEDLFSREERIIRAAKKYRELQDRKLVDKIMNSKDG